MLTERWRRIFELFDATRGLPASDRHAFLAAECADDDALRAEVQSLLDADGEVGCFLSPSPRFDGGKDSAHSRPASPTYAPGTHLGTFLIESFIGAGGMGEVYRARDTRLDRLVAIKVLSPGGPFDRYQRTRFAHEARAIARLSHPRICTLHDVGHDDGVDFLVLEHLDGETLAQRLARGPLPMPEAMRIATEIADALGAAHAKGIVHRDLKPSNVMLAEGGTKLLDFGLARLRTPSGSPVGSAGTESVSVAAPGYLAGTLPYMAPEQLRAEDTDARTDIFAFGAVLYEMLAGRRAFRADSQAAMVAAVLEHDPPPLSDWMPQAPPSLVALVRRCLEKDPNRRWQATQELALELKTIADADARDSNARLGRRRAEPSTVRPPRTRVIGALLAVFLPALVALGWWGWVGERAAARPLTLAVLPFDHLGPDRAREYLADGLTEETSAWLGQIDPAHLRVKGRISTFRYKRTNKSIAQIGRELGADYLLESSLQAEGEHLRLTATLIRVRDEVQVWSASFDREVTSLLGIQQELSRALAQQIRLRLSPERLAALASRESRSAEAYDLYLRGRSLWNQFTPATTREAIQYFQRATALDPDYGLAWAAIGDAYSAGPINGDAEPLRVIPLAREAVTRAAHAAPALSEVQASLGLYEFWLNWDWDAAEAALRTAITLDPSSPLGHRLLGIVLSHGKQRRDEARAAMNRARELDPLSAMDQALSAQVAFAARDRRAAVAFARQAVVIDPQFWIGHYQLAQAYEQAGRADLALTATVDSQRCPGGTNSKTLSLRGYLLAKTGKASEAREVLATLDGVSHQRYVPPYASALVYAGLGDREAVFARLEAAYAAHDVHLALLQVDSKWDPYRTDPRFAALVARCGFFSHRSSASTGSQ